MVWCEFGQVGGVAEWECLEIIMEALVAVSRGLGKRGLGALGLRLPFGGSGLDVLLQIHPHASPSRIKN